jgi:hypothetical protein
VASIAFILILSKKGVGMNLKLIKMWMCLVAMLSISSNGYAASNAVNIGANGITFSDNSVQSKAAVLPVCSSGEVIVNNAGAWLCGTILPVDKGIATCVSDVCSISACQPGWGSCGTTALNGCGTSLTTTQNCGACGNICPANNICSSGACVAITQPVKAIVKIATTGTLSGGTLIGGINALLKYPTNKGLTFFSAVPTVPGIGVNSTHIPNPNVTGQVSIGIINAGPTFTGDPTGITQVGDFDTITFNIAAGNFPVAADFTTLSNGVSLTGSGIIDTHNNTLSPGINVAITSVTFQ